MHANIAKEKQTFDNLTHATEFQVKWKPPAWLQLTGCQSAAWIQGEEFYFWHGKGVGHHVLLLCSTNLPPAHSELDPAAAHLIAHNTCTGKINAQFIFHELCEWDLLEGVWCMALWETLGLGLLCWLKYQSACFKTVESCFCHLTSLFDIYNIYQFVAFMLFVFAFHSICTVLQ